ncbi:hypothetical protein Pla175_51010 [Pirellulimonas nuda]|uniref:Phosphoinositide phospholipase C, Ca2+-dependent n=1 Tax=Pirellulimonas nuda TaxID=2528009 RepID=A0A518DJL0_9BACT|nr:phosphatidylinositol-specific phospholipase C1-like protein [Pirellulimonas nuda]QDU91671.1 hypothetical protein Pla175_51010 [Pirellulimonas nuda]
MVFLSCLPLPPRLRASARGLAIVALLAPLAACAEAPVTLDRVQLIGSHNSFKAPIDPPLLRTMATFSADAWRLDYAHAPLPEQLELGLRAFEIDVYHDPQGGVFAKPAGIELMRSAGAQHAPFDPQGVMLRPGYKVLHVPDIDFRSNCPTLALALAQFKAWSAANPGHLPVVVTMNVSDQRAPLPGAATPPKIDAGALDRLDAELRAGLGDHRLLTPDFVRGDADSLESAVLDGGWPTVERAAGRFLFVLDEGGAKRDAYIAGHPSLRGRVLFTNSPAGSPEAAFHIVNNPIKDGARIRDLVARGYLVRTRADAETVEARKNDTRRFVAAVESGAQVISTDYYVADPRVGPYRVRFDDGGFVRYKPEAPHPAATKAPP